MNIENAENIYHKLVSSSSYTPTPHGWLCPAVHPSSRNWVLPPEQRMSSAGGPRAAAPRAAPMAGWFMRPLALALPLLAPACPTLIPCLSGLSCPSLVPRLAPMEQALPGPAAPLGAPRVQQPPTSLFTISQRATLP